MTMLGDNTSFGIQRSANAAIGDTGRVARVVPFAFPLIEAVTTRLLELYRQASMKDAERQRRGDASHHASRHRRPARMN
jgi:hypothetical protein